MTGVVAYLLSQRYTKTAIKELGSVLTFKGVVATYNDLPKTGNKQGDIYQVVEKSAEYVWLNATETVEAHWELFGEMKTTNIKFPSEWPIEGTTLAFCNVVNADSTAVAGQCYYGGVKWSDLPDSLTNGEVVVSVFESTLGGKVLHLDLYSATTSPYYWSCNYYNGSVTPWSSGGGSSSPYKYVTNITGDGTTTSFTITHSLNSRDIAVVVYDATSYDQLIVNTTFTSLDTLTLTFAEAPTTSETYTVACLLPLASKGDKGDPGNVQDVTKNGVSVVNAQGVAILPDSGLVDDVLIGGTSIVTDKVANITEAKLSAINIWPYTVTIDLA